MAKSLALTNVSARPSQCLPVCAAYQRATSKLSAKCTFARVTIDGSCTCSATMFSASTRRPYQRSRSARVIIAFCSSVHCTSSTRVRACAGAATPSDISATSSSSSSGLWATAEQAEPLCMDGGGHDPVRERKLFRNRPP